MFHHTPSIEFAFQLLQPHHLFDKWHVIFWPPVIEHRSCLFKGIYHVSDNRNVRDQKHTGAMLYFFWSIDDWYDYLALYKKALRRFMTVEHAAT